MDNVNKTLYIPLYGKAYVSRKEIILHDPKAEEIWSAEGFPLKGKSRSKWLAYYMGMRSAVFDLWLVKTMQEYPEAVILHLGCGMDSRIDRVGTRGHLWFDVDFPDVITERRRYYPETEAYRMIPSDIRESRWLETIPGGTAIIMAEGVSMYLQPEQLRAVVRNLKAHFSKTHILMDFYTEFAAKASRRRNPINDVGVTQVYGWDDPTALGIPFVKEHNMTPGDLIGQLEGMERTVFRHVFAGNFARKLYRLYEFG